jgi:predicted MPP superfamily phosphohydrolase
VLAPALAAGGALAWGYFEAGWVRLREVPVRLERLPPELDGLRIAHLSDLHLGFPSRGELAVERAFAWVRERRPELVVITGDLLARPRGEALLRRLLDGVGPCFAVLGNHDVGQSRDPFSKPSLPLDLGATTILADEGRTIELRGRRVQLVGLDPRSYRAGRARPARLVDPAAELRILLCHYPHVVDRVRPGSFHLVLAGHLHAGQINLPYGVGTLRFGDPRKLHRRWRYVAGLYHRPGTVLHLSPGLGTSFVPFRFFARPEASELVLQSV